MAFFLDDGGTNSANRSMLATFTIDFTNTDYNSSSGRGTPHIHINNNDATGQSMISFTINSTIRAKMRADYVGNVTYVANGGTHSFLTGGEVGSAGSTEQLSIGTDGVINFTGAPVVIVSGSTATLGGIGSGGPTNTAQTGWIKIKIAGSVRWLPYWS